MPRAPSHVVRAFAASALALGAGAQAAPALTPGLYRTEVHIALPNVPRAAAPLVVIRCLNSADLESGRAFSVLSANPLARCDMLDYEWGGDLVTYRIYCPGPNRGSAQAAFKTAATSYRGSIRMNMGGKNMTLSETQVGRRIGDCR
jgi:hypothetical protein